MSARQKVPRELQQLVRDALPGVSMRDGGVEEQLEAKAAREMQHYLHLLFMRTTAEAAHAAETRATEQRVLAMLEAIRPTLRE